MSLQIIDPTRYPGWDELLLRTPGASFFHSSSWAKVLAESYGYTPLYFTILENGILRALVPFMEVNSFLTGKRGVSLPFTDYCEPIIDEGLRFHDLFDHIIEYGKKRGWKYVELRGGEKYLRSQESVVSSQESVGSNVFPVSRFLAPGSLLNNPGRLPGNSEHGTRNIFPYITYLGHTLDLTRGEKPLYFGLRDSTRRNIKKAEKEKVEVRVETTLGAVDEFYRLNCLTRRDHGIPPQSHHFFSGVHREVISKGNGFVALAYYQGKAIAGNVYFHFGRHAIYKYGASDKRYQGLRANNLVMWEAIKWFCGEGFESLCLGRTDPGNGGLHQFKRGWGTEEHPIHYFRYDLRQRAYVAARQKGKPVYTGIIRATPVPVLNVIGSLLYKHMG